MNIVGIIPARMGSFRFPGKPLADILGTPMLGHVYFRSKMSKFLKEVYIATCDKEIADYATSIGARCIMTKDSHKRCLDRASEALLKIEIEAGEKVDVAVVIQGDEPIVYPEMIDMSVAPIIEDPSIQVVNLMTSIKDREEHNDPNCPKVVVDKNNFALYFSREPIPSWRMAHNMSVKMLKQVPIMPLTRDLLLKFSELEPTDLEKIESIDMNRLLEHGYKIKMVIEDFETHSVDVPADLETVKQIMSSDKLISKYAL